MKSQPIQTVEHYPNRSNKMHTPILHTNIEKSAFRKGEYVGYCFGAQRIRRGGQGWETYSLGSSAGHFVYATAPTLHALGLKLEKIKEAGQPNKE